jgi:hypothetical protein
MISGQAKKSVLFCFVVKNPGLDKLILVMGDATLCKHGPDGPGSLASFVDQQPFFYGHFSVQHVCECIPF